MSEATLIFPNMRGGCVTVGKTVHTLFRVNGRRPGVATLIHKPDAMAQSAQHSAPDAPSMQDDRTSLMGCDGSTSS